MCKLFIVRFFGLLIFTVGLLMWGCDSDGDSDGTIPLPIATTGQVALLVTDASVEDFSSIRITVTQVELLSEDLGQQTIWEGRQEIDLLELSSISEIFAVGEVPTGVYDKIRLHVDPDSLVFEPPADFRLPGNVDKIDLTPVGKFELSENGLWIQIDINAAKTLAVSNGGILRPVIFVDVVDGSVTQRLTRLRGEIAEVNDASVVICHPTVANADFCPTVTVGESTSVFRSDPNGNLLLSAPSSLSDLDVGDVAVAYGHVAATSESLAAVVLEVGEAFLIRPLRGTVQAVSETSTLLLALANNAMVAPVTVDYALARFFRCTGEAFTEEEQLRLADLLTGTDVKMDGIYNATVPLLQSTIGITAADCDGSQTLSGTVESIDDPAQQRVTVRVSGAGPVCAQFREHSRIMIGSLSGMDVYDLHPGAFTDLTPGREIAMFGMHLEGEPCFQVETAMLDIVGGN